MNILKGGDKDEEMIYDFNSDFNNINEMFIETVKVYLNLARLYDEELFLLINQHLNYYIEYKRIAQLVGIIDLIISKGCLIEFIQIEELKLFKS